MSHVSIHLSHQEALDLRSALREAERLMHLGGYPRDEPSRKCLRDLADTLTVGKPLPTTPLPNKEQDEKK